jgi:hypothetical protein
MWQLRRVLRPGFDDPARGLRLCSRGNWAEHLICRKGDAHSLRKVSMEELGGVGPLTKVNKRCCRRCCLPGPLCRPLAVLKALTGQKVCGIRTTRDVGVARPEKLRTNLRMLL